VRLATRIKGADLRVVENCKAGYQEFCSEPLLTATMIETRSDKNGTPTILR
jgi:hypothetical protein